MATKYHDSGHNPSSWIRERPTMFTALLPDGREGIILQRGTLDVNDGCFYPGEDGLITQLEVSGKIVYCPTKHLGHGLMLQWR